jgi:voltage-gated sodium channel
MELFPLSWLFFLPFIIITSFAVLNFFIGIIVDSMQMAQKLEAEELGRQPDGPATHADVQLLVQKMDQLQAEVHALKARSESQ